MIAVVGEARRQSLPQGDLGPPTQLGPNLVVIPVVISDIDGFALGRKRHNLEMRAGSKFDERLRQLPKADDFLVSKVVDVSVGAGIHSREKERLNDVVDIIEIPQLVAVAVDQDRLAFDCILQPHPEKRLSRVLDPHAWAVGIRESQRASPYAVDIVVE